MLKTNIHDIQIKARLIKQVLHIKPFTQQNVTWFRSSRVSCGFRLGFKILYSNLLENDSIYD